MYIPGPFRVDDTARLHAFIEANSFALLISNDENGPVGSHLPLLLRRDENRLIGHMARENGQWRSADGTDVMVVFSGPHGYISPSWYAEPNVVPTWNYVAVHANGTFRVVNDRAHHLRIVQDTVAYYEGGMAHPWSADWSSAYIDRLLDQTVAFEIDLKRLEGKWKLGQNHSINRRERVVEALRASSSQADHALAGLINETIPANPASSGVASGTN